MAVMPTPEERKLLDMKAGEPCLLLRRQTWSAGRPVTWALLLHPADRYRLGGRFSAQGARS
jgi:GntR family histidine utilization transcriptional repressor